MTQRATQPTSSDSMPPTHGQVPAPARRSLLIPVAILAGAIVIVALLVSLVMHAESKINKVALASEAKPVTVVAADGKSFRDTRKYVGTLRPWIEASVGPQYISVYVDTVLVRPGAVVKRGEVLATLDCRNASAESQAVAAEARAIEASQRAVADKSARLNQLLAGKYVSENEAEMTSAESASEQAKVAAEKAKLTKMTLDVNDCVMRAPFDGEVATRSIDPGAFVRPGMAIVSVVDRNTVRMTIDVPESDFDMVAAGILVNVHVVSTGKDIPAKISRRAPSADPGTRTVHVEIDMDDPKREIPVNTTGEVSIEVGEPIPATSIPLVAASVTGKKANIWTVEGGVAHQSTFHVLGEQGDNVFLDTSLKPGTQVVTEGQFVLSDGDHVQAKQVPYGSAQAKKPSAAPAAATEKMPEAKP
jgi:membrane fusion protein (multidrug efflux system)